MKSDDCCSSAVCCCNHVSLRAQVSAAADRPARCTASRPLRCTQSWTPSAINKRQPSVYCWQRLATVDMPLLLHAVCAVHNGGRSVRYTSYRRRRSNVDSTCDVPLSPHIGTKLQKEVLLFLKVLNFLKHSIDVKWVEGTLYTKNQLGQYCRFDTIPMMNFYK